VRIQVLWLKPLSSYKKITSLYEVKNVWIWFIIIINVIIPANVISLSNTR
jgi:hypothetical protein